MRRLAYWLTIGAGATAAYLMWKRGESLPQVAKKAMTNPVGSFVSEIRR